MIKQNKKVLISVIILFTLFLVAIWAIKNVNFNRKYTVGQPIDSLNAVAVYFNGAVNNVSGRNLTADGYNLGQKYQCVEFVKRYYYQCFNHKMPDAYGNAKDFFDKTLSDGELNEKRDLLQFSNSSHTQPKEGDLVIFKGNIFNRYGHVAIISKVEKGNIEIIQQNAGQFSKTRKVYLIEYQNDKYKIKSKRILGWLRKKDTPA
jgi:surface antigen